MKLFKTDRIVPAVTISLVVLFSIMLYVDFNRKFTQSRAGEIGTLTYKKRSAERRFAEEVLWENIEQNAKVFNCDYLKTTDDSGAVVHLKDNSDIEIGENTLILVCYSDRGVEIDLDKGSIAARRTAGGREMRIRSDSASIKMKKGVLSVKKSEEGVNLAVSSGTADITVGDRKGEIDPGKTARVSGNSVTIEKIPVRQVSPDINRYFVTAGKERAVTFSWETEGPQQVTLQVARDGAFSSIAGKTATTAKSAVMSLPGGAYYWRIIDGKGKAGPSRKFTIVTDRPAIPVAPLDGQQYVYREKKPFIVFKWQESPAASSYSIDIGKDPSFGEPVLSLASDRNSIAVDSLPAGTYYWRIRNNYGFGAEEVLASRPGRFSISLAPGLAAPRQLVPNDGTQSSDLALSSGAVVFNWDESGDFGGYDFRMAGDREFRNVVYQKRTAVNFHKPRIALPNGTYYWSVSGVTPSGKLSPPSGPRSFTVVKARPPALAGPESGAAVNSLASKEIKFTWVGVNGGQRYRFELSRQRDFGKLLRSDMVSEPSHAIAMPAPGRYFWRVRVLDEAGGTVLTSDARGFTVAAALGSPSAVHPVNSEAVAVDMAKGLEFKWNEVAGATQYRFRLKQVAATGEKVLATASVDSPRYVFKRIELLDAGSFAWEVTAVMEKGGAVSAQSKPETFYFSIKPGQKLEAPKLKSDIIYVE